MTFEGAGSKNASGQPCSLSWPLPHPKPQGHRSLQTHLADTAGHTSTRPGGEWPDTLCSAAPLASTTLECRP